MRVALLGSYPTWPFREQLRLRRDTRHVTSTWNVNLAEGLARRGSLDVHVVTLAAGIPESRTLQLSDRLRVHFVTMPRWQKGLDLAAGMRWSQHRVRSALRRIAPAVVHGIGTEHPFAAIATRLPWPSVVTVHGVMQRITTVTGSPWWSSKRAFARMERRTLERAGHVIVINPYVLEALAIPSTTVRYAIENPVDRLFFEPFVEKPREGLVFAGMIQPAKGLDVLLAALAHFGREERPRLTIIGPPVPGSEAYAQSLRQFARDEGIGESLKWVGKLDAPQLRGRLRGARGLVLPSRVETAPMVIAEALASGTPVVASDVGGIRHMVQDGRTGYLVPPDRPDDLAQAIRSVLLLDEAASTRARREAERRFHPDRVAEATEDVYRRVADL